MELEQTAPANPEATPATSELPPEQAAHPADGGVVQNPEQQAPEGEGEPAPAKPQTPPHRQAAPRFSDMSRQIRERDMQLAEMRGKLSAFEQLGIQPSGQPQTHQPAPISDGRPDPERYDGGEYDPRYTEDLARFAAREEFARLGQERQQQQVFQTGQQRFAEAFHEADTAAAEDPGFENAPHVLETIGRHDPSTADVLVACENRLYVAEYLGQGNRMRQLAAMPPLERARMIGYLDATIGANLKAQPAPAVTPAPQPAPAPSPAPTTNLSGRGATPGPDIKKMSPSEYREFRMNGGTF